MRIAIACTVAIILLVVGCSGGENKTDEIVSDDRYIGEDEFPVDDFSVYNAEVNLDIAPHNREGRMLVTERFTVTANNESTSFVIEDEEWRGEFDAGFVNEYADKGKSYKNSPITEGIDLRLAQFRVLKNGTVQPVTFKTRRVVESDPHLGKKKLLI